MKQLQPLLLCDEIPRFNKLLRRDDDKEQNQIFYTAFCSILMDIYNDYKDNTMSIALQAANMDCSEYKAGSTLKGRTGHVSVFDLLTFLSILKVKDEDFLHRLRTIEHLA